MIQFAFATYFTCGGMIALIAACTHNAKMLKRKSSGKALAGQIALLLIAWPVVLARMCYTAWERSQV